MADHGRRRVSRRVRRRDDRASGFASLPKDENWTEALRDEFSDDVRPGAPFDQLSISGAMPFDRLAPPEPPALERPGPVEGTPSEPALWSGVQAELEAQRSTILALAARLDAMEASLDGLARRVPNEPPDAPSQPAGVSPGSGPPPPPTVREAVDALRTRVLDSAVRLGREVARRRPARP